MKRLSPWLAAAASVALGACQQLVMLENHGADGGGGGGAPPVDGPAPSNDGRDSPGGLGGDGGQTNGTDLREDRSCTGSQFHDVSRVKVYTIVSFDRSSSMSTPFGEGTRLSVGQQALREAIRPYQNAVRFGYNEFPGNTTTCTAALGCCAGNVLIPVEGNADSIERKMADCENRPGTCITAATAPIAEALTRCRSAFANTSSGDRYILLVTDSEPSCPRGRDMMSACEDASSEAGDLNNNSSIKTIVVGVGDEVAHSDCLNDIASAGGAPRPGNPMQQFYPARDSTSLKTYIGEIIRNMAKRTCQLDVLEIPDDPERVSLYFAGREIPRDRANRNGWNFDGAIKITVYGAHCEMLQSGRIPDREIKLVSACP